MKTLAADAPPGAAGHFLELDGMRGALAATVMLYHFGLNTLLGQFTGGVLGHGAWGLCVDFFFLLSGFVLCRSFLGRPVDLGRYSVKRLLRLAPMFLLTTLATLALVGAGQWSSTTILANLLMVQSMVGQSSVNFVSWSIPFELFLPALALISVAHIRRAGLWPVIALLAIAASASLWATLRFAQGLDIPWIRASAGLAAGALLYLVRDFTAPQVHRRAAPITLALFAGVMLVMAIGGVLPHAALVFTPLSLAVIWFGAGARGLFSTPPLQALGRWSYSIYLTHPVLIIGANLLFGEGRMDGNVGLKIAVILATLAISALCYRLVEAPFMALGQKLTAGRRQAAAPAI